MASIRQLLEVSLTITVLSIFLDFVVLDLIGFYRSWSRIVSFSSIVVTFLAVISGIYVYFRTIRKIEFNISGRQGLLLIVVLVVMYSLQNEIIVLIRYPSYYPYIFSTPILLRLIVSSGIGYICGMFTEQFLLRAQNK